jgi:manganese-dependent inorganic pyrophosphatase
MVDHNEPGQAVLGLEAADVIEVLDHHRLSSVPTAVPIRFRVEPVGSCSTLVMERANELHQRFPAPVAGLLLCGILSDTLTFRSPTATGRDRDAATDLAVMAGLASADADEDHIMAIISELGSALLAAGAGLGARPADEVVNTDIKFYEVNGMNVGVAQVEVANFSELPPRLPELRDALTHLAESRDLKLALLMVTDVVLGNSRLVAVGQPRLISALPYPRLGDDTLDAPGVMSRKKQLLPLVLAVLSQSAA